MLKGVEIVLRNSVQEIVKEDYRTADIFHQYGINYCCGARISLEDVCENLGLNIDTIRRELEFATRSTPALSFTNVHQWHLDFLLDYIINIHHVYLRQNLPLVNEYMVRFKESHGMQFKFLDELCYEVQKLHTRFISYLDEEENIIFPYIRQINSAHLHNENYAGLLVRTLKKPVGNIYKSQQHELNLLLSECRRIADNYVTPEKTCITHKVCFAKLAELDNNITHYIYIENEILFPKTISLEKYLTEKK